MPRQEQIDLPQAIRQAAALHQQGQMAEAEGLYSTILKAKPDHFDALHLLGVLMHQRGRSTEALAFITRALEANSRSAMACANLGRILESLNRHEEALANYDKALALEPDQTDVLFHRGNVLIRLKRAAEALASYDRVLALAPTHVDALTNRGVAWLKLKRPDDAVASFERALALKPDHPMALANRGNALLDAGRLTEALASIDQALAIEPGNAETHYNRGNILFKLDRFAEAISSYDQTLALSPTHFDALANRGSALLKSRRPSEALASHERALAISPGNAEVLINRGNALMELNRLSEALASFDRSIEARPDYVEAIINRGNVLMELRRPTDALASYDRALEISPGNAEAHWNKSLVWLTLGDFERGWSEYEWRSKKADENHERGFSQPKWLGQQSLDGRTILLHAEQGFGDAIQFVRYAPLVAAKGAKIILEVQRPLAALVSSIEGVATVISRGDELPPFDVHCSLMSLPLAFQTALATIPADVPYLRAPQDRLEKWRNMLPDAKSLRVGITWSGNPAVKNDYNRSMTIERFAALLSIPGVEFINIQQDVREGDREALQRLRRVLSPGRELEDFADTAAVISLLDLVISTDTAVAHLAGALGKPVWLLLAFNCDWRWMLDRDDSPWYPSARLYRQAAIDDWDSVLSQVGHELSLLAGRSA